MYTWGYIKEAALAKLDKSAIEATKIGLINKFPFYANEAMTQICSSIKAKATFAKFNVWKREEYYTYLTSKYNLPANYDFSFLNTRPCNVEDLPIAPYDEQAMWNEYINSNITFTQEIVRMPSDFVSFGDDINRVRFTISGRTTDWNDATDEDWSTMGTNSVMFKLPGEYLLSYDARWFTFSPTIDDNEELDVPNDILDAIPSYIVFQCYKIDDESKANTYNNEFEVFCSRIEDNKARTNKVFHLGGNW